MEAGKRKERENKERSLRGKGGAEGMKRGVREGKRRERIERTGREA